MSKMELAFIEEVKYYIENMIYDYEYFNNETDISESIYEKLKNISDSEIKKITTDVINDSYLWQKINKTIEEKIKEQLEGEE